VLKTDIFTFCTPSPSAFQPSLYLAPGEVGTAFIDKGVDFSFGGREGIFSDPPLAFSGVSNSNNVDLISPVDGRIVLPGTLNNGLTSFLSIEAGFSDPGQLLLEVFDAGGSLLSSVANNLPLGPNGRTTLTIDRGGIFDIASFKVSTPVNDAFGVDFIKLETPVAAGSQPVPEPFTILGSLTAGGIGNTLRLSNQSVAQISTLSKKQISQAEQLEKQLNQATPQQIDNFLKSQGRSLDGKNPEEFKTQVLSQVSQAKKQIKTQAEATQSFRGLSLIKSSVKWNLGALVAGGLFISIWKGTRWARTN
jgi:hypothetical protein